MKRYYDKTTHNEVTEESSTTIELGSGVIDWWFEELPEGMMVTYLKDGTPKLDTIPLPVVDEHAEKLAKLKQELDAIVGDLTPAESMYLMLQYGFAKMQPSDAEDDPGVSLTPTGEDIITWGDRIAQELGDKLLEIKKLK